MFSGSLQNSRTVRSGAENQDLRRFGTHRPAPRHPLQVVRPEPAQADHRQRPGRLVGTGNQADCLAHGMAGSPNRIHTRNRHWWYCVN